MVNLFKEKNKYDIGDLIAITKLLRSPEGCPWDREQTHRSIRRNFIEEAYEAVEGIDVAEANPELLKEELGDVLLQVVFHSEMEDEKGVFGFDDVADRVVRKLILRHPHIFGDTVASDSQEVLKNWDEIKKSEKGQTTLADQLEDVAASLPALLKADKLVQRVKKSGAELPDVHEVAERIRVFINAYENGAVTVDGGGIADEIGQALFALVIMSNRLGCDPESSLGRACMKFIEKCREIDMR